MKNRESIQAVAGMDYKGLTQKCQAESDTFYFHAKEYQYQFIIYLLPQPEFGDIRLLGDWQYVVLRKYLKRLLRFLTG